MRKATSILFLLIYLAAATELHQILHLPVFFEHYGEHRQSNPTIDLVDFIVIHYFNGDYSDPEVGRDQQLPFKANCPEVSISLAMPPEDFPEAVAKVFSISTDDILYKPAFKASSFHFAIWQPPRA